MAESDVNGREDGRTAPRLEVKVPLPARYRAQVAAWVRVHTAQWRVAYPPRQVNNVYLDTPDFAGLLANLSGIAERSKLRLRWYGPDEARVTAGVLELKRKQGAAGWKHLCAVPGTFDLGALSWRAFEQALRAAVPPHALAWLDRFAVPVLINRYRRAYYETPDRDLRLTLDTELRAYDQRTSARPNLERSATMPEQIVVELKAPAEPGATRRLAQALAHFPVPADRFSKYVHGVLGAPNF
jgi:hypothetical protein